MEKLLVLDNYDSFIYNLVYYLRESSDNLEINVFRNDKIGLEEIDKYDRILLSPGPGLPHEAGILKQLIGRYGKDKKILGVCLGHQAIAEVYGGSLKQLDRVFHGISTAAEIIDFDEQLFRGIPANLSVGRYHSWLVDKETLPACLGITAVDDRGEIMAIRHKEFKISGVQFHPESVLTEYGMKMIANWLI
ncbi:MAG: aminodeoxychorismate/anthranilate synthase component II [Bacteroidales bacterium]|nr:aminodeoxychorismate/anthranilate synthase component II [Bacteroidales bacterium]